MSSREHVKNTTSKRKGGGFDIEECKGAKGDGSCRTHAEGIRKGLGSTGLGNVCDAQV